MPSTTDSKIKEQEDGLLEIVGGEKKGKGSKYFKTRGIIHSAGNINGIDFGHDAPHSPINLKDPHADRIDNYLPNCRSSERIKTKSTPRCVTKHESS